MKIKNIILPLFISLITLLSCGPSGNSFRLKGTIQGMQEGEIYIFNTSVDNARFDTLRIDGGNFYYGGSTEEVTPYIIVFPNALEQVVFIGPGEEIEYEAVSNDLNNYSVKGSDENKLMNKFNQTVNNKSYSERQAEARRFISANPKSTVSLYIFDKYFVQNAQTTYKELNDVYKTLSPHHKDNTYFMALEGRVKAMKELNIGDSFPNVKFSNKKNVKSSIWSGSASDYTTVLCWATWISSSYEVLAKIREIARENPKNKMRVVAFSIDNEFERWSNMTQFDSISTIEHYIDTRAFSSQLINEIGINTLPTYFVIDSNHKIVAKGSESKALDQDVKKVLNK